MDNSSSIIPHCLIYGITIIGIILQYIILPKERFSSKVVLRENKIEIIVDTENIISIKFS